MTSSVGIVILQEDQPILLVVLAGLERAVGELGLDQIRRPRRRSRLVMPAVGIGDRLPAGSGRRSVYAGGARRGLSH